MDNSKAAVQIFNKLAKLYASKYMDVGLYHESLDLFCESLTKDGPEILEIACGPGNITQYLLQKRADFKIFGIDLAPNMIELAIKNNPTAQFNLMDCREIGAIERKFDAVICGFCLPYLTKEESEILISDVSEKLKAGGIFYLSTIEDDHAKSGIQKASSGDEVFMNYYEGNFLVDVLQRNNFEIIDLKRITTTPNGAQVIDVIIIANWK